MHAPGHLRDGFVTLICGDEHADGLFFYDEGKQKRWDRMDEQERLRWLSGQLWNCTDILPALYCEDVGLPPGSTYAQAARNVR